MLRQSLRPARLRGPRTWPVPISVHVARMGLVRPYSDHIMSNGMMRQWSNHETTKDSRSPNDPTQTFAQADRISSVIRQDHREIKRYYDKIVKSNDLDIQRRYQNAFVWELTRHAIAEELVLYPAIETGVNDGKVMVDKDRAEHQVVCIAPSASTYTILLFGVSSPQLLTRHRQHRPKSSSTNSRT